MKDGGIVWYYNKKYLCSLKTETTVFFKTLKDHLDIAYYDTINSILYFNDLYKGRFKKVKRQIIKDIKPEVVSDYLEL